MQGIEEQSTRLQGNLLLFDSLPPSCRRFSSCLLYRNTWVIGFATPSRFWWCLSFSFHRRLFLCPLLTFRFCCSNFWFPLVGSMWLLGLCASRCAKEELV